jgi:hypothetical protein
MRSRPLALLFLVSSIFMLGHDALQPTRAEDLCTQNHATALEQVQEAFNDEIRALKADQARQGGENDKTIARAIANVTSLHDSVVKEIEKATHDCQAHISEPEKILSLAQDFSERLDEQTPSRPHPHWGRKRGNEGDASSAGGSTLASADPSALDAALKKLVAGNIAFNNPERMTLGQSEIVQVKLSTTLSPDGLKAQLTEAGKKETDELEVGDRMSATLTGGDAFTIAPSGAQVQWVSRSQVTTWTWDVTPRLSGNQYLILAFDAVITLRGKDGTRNVSTLTHQIEVDVGWPETPSEWLDLSKKWFENISWLWASIVVPIGLFLIGWWRKRVRT